MASEPRNYPDYVFVAYDEDFSAQTYDIAVSLEPGNLVGRPVKYIRHDLNTRPAPAATDTGLETVAQAYVNDDMECEEIAWIKGFYPHQECIQLVTRSQAEELLAAEREAQQRLLDIIEEANDDKEALEADNAELTARVKELEEDVEWAQNAVLARQRHAEARCEALEAKLAAAEKALEPFAKAALGYDDPDENGPWPDIQDVFVTLGDCRRARAVLGGKPS